MEEDELFYRDDEDLLNTVKKKLGLFARGLIWLKKKHTEQIIFISSESYLRRVAADMMSAKTNIHTKMERKILKDIREIKYKNDRDGKDTDANDIEAKDLKRT